MSRVRTNVTESCNAESQHGTVEVTPSGDRGLLAPPVRYRFLTSDILSSGTSDVLFRLVRFGTFVMLGGGLRSVEHVRLRGLTFARLGLRVRC